MREHTFNPEDDLPTRIERMRGALKVCHLVELLGLEKSKIYEMVSSGCIPHYRLDGCIRFDPRVTAEWLRARMVPAAA